MEVVAEGAWGLADYHERNGEMGKAIKCLESICQSHVSLLPIVEVKTRLRIATLLLRHSHNLNHAKSHLQRSQLLLMSIPSCFELKCRAYSLLSQCYHLVGAIPLQVQTLNKALELSASSAAEGFAAKLWSCNFNSQLANALIIEGDYQGSLSALDTGFKCASEIYYPELQMFFATSSLHVHLMQWEDTTFVENAVNKCDEIWESIEPDKRQQCTGLRFYNQLLHIFYLLRICDYKNAAHLVEDLDASMKADSQKMREVEKLKQEINAIDLSLSGSNIQYKDRLSLSKKKLQLEEQLTSITCSSSADRESLEPAYFGNVRRAWGDKLELASPPIDGEWLPKSAVYALIELMVVVFGRPKGLFKELDKRIQSGMQTIKDELGKLGIDDGTREVDLQHSAIWMAGVYLMLLMQFFENKVAVDLTRSEFVDAQEALVQMRNWFSRFPTILQASESMIEMLRGQYAHSLAAYSEATYHYTEAAKLTQSKSTQAMCQLYAAISYICIGGQESSAQAVDLIGPVYGMMDSFVGVREKTTVLFAYGFLLMRQHNLQEARVRLASGLQVAHTHLGNLQLVSQYLTILGNLALALLDTVQAKEILRSALTLAKKLHDIPTQIWVLTNLSALYQQIDEKDKEMENTDFQSKRLKELHKRLDDARSSSHHAGLIEKTRIHINQCNEKEMKLGTAGPSLNTTSGLDIPESVGLSASAPASSRLMDVDIARRGKRKKT